MAGHREPAVDGRHQLHALLDTFAWHAWRCFAIFVDLRRAFPSLSRPVAFANGHAGGVGGKLLAAVVALNSGTTTRIGLADGTESGEIAVSLGVFEGRVNSPRVFGWSIDTLEAMLAGARMPDGRRLGVLDGSVRLLLLLFVDDDALLAPDAEVAGAMLEVVNKNLYLSEFLKVSSEYKCSTVS